MGGVQWSRNNLSERILVKTHTYRRFNSVYHRQDSNCWTQTVLMSKIDKREINKKKNIIEYIDIWSPTKRVFFNYQKGSSFLQFEQLVRTDNSFLRYYTTATKSNHLINFSFNIFSILYD